MLAKHEEMLEHVCHQQDSLMALADNFRQLVNDLHPTVSPAPSSPSPIPSQGVTFNREPKLQLPLRYDGKPEVGGSYPSVYFFLELSPLTLCLSFSLC